MSTDPDHIIIVVLALALASLALVHAHLWVRHRRAKRDICRIRKERNEARTTLWNMTHER